MLTINKVLSTIRSRNLWLAEDTEISDRFLYKVAQTAAAFLVKNEFNKGRLLTSDNVFQVLECSDLKPSSPVECDIPAKICSKVRKGTLDLDGLGESELGYSIMGVFNIINSEEIYPTTVREFINLKSLRIKPNKLYYLIKKGRIFVLDEDIEKVNMYVYSTEDLTNKDKCKYMGDREFKLPGYLERQFYILIDQELQRMFNPEVDQNDNNNEEKSRK